MLTGDVSFAVMVILLSKDSVKILGFSLLIYSIFYISIFILLFAVQCKPK